MAEIVVAHGREVIAVFVYRAPDSQPAKWGGAAEAAGFGVVESHVVAAFVGRHLDALIVGVEIVRNEPRHGCGGGTRGRRNGGAAHGAQAAPGTSGRHRENYKDSAITRKVYAAPRSRNRGRLNIRV